MKPMPEYEYVERLRQKIRELADVVDEIGKDSAFPFEVRMGLPDGEKPPVPRRERGNG
jgi:hypothetical protein